MLLINNNKLIINGKSVLLNNKQKVNTNNQIMYTSSTNAVIEPYNISFGGANVISNTYENGVGIITFDTDVTQIGYQAFSDCSSLTSITIPNSVASIGLSAFYNCSGLTSIEIPNLVTSIDHGVFASCSELTSIVVLSIVPPSLGSSVFYQVHSDFIIYVPEESVDIYKTATSWKIYADKIKPISEKPA